MTTLTTCLWSPDNKALEMAEYYCSVFPDSKITTTGLYDEANPHLPGSKAGDVMIVEFTLFGEDKFATLNGGPYFKHSCAASWMIPCKNQEELDYYYDRLSAKPEAEMCGWVCDQFGVSWHLIPENFTEYMRSGTPEGKSKLMKATMEMKKLSWEAIEKAYNSYIMIMTPREIAQKYFALSNQRNLDTIENIIHPEAIYNSNVTGLYFGKANIMQMMRRFFERFEFLEWKIHSIKEIQNGMVEIYFTATFRNQDGTIEKSGIEIIGIKDGLITSVEVRNN